MKKIIASLCIVLSSLILTGCGGGILDGDLDFDMFEKEYESYNQNSAIEIDIIDRNPELFTSVLDGTRIQVEVDYSNPSYNAGDNCWEMSLVLEESGSGFNYHYWHVVTVDVNQSSGTVLLEYEVNQNFLDGHESPYLFRVYIEKTGFVHEWNRSNEITFFQYS